jgi:hypothetical protein
MKTPTKVITALALAGLAVAGGAAFTGDAGLSIAAAPDQFFGGNATQIVSSGATVLTAEYTYSADTDPVKITDLDLTFTPDALLEDQPVTLTFTGASTTNGGALTLDCTVIDYTAGSPGTAATHCEKTAGGFVDAEGVSGVKIVVGNTH